MIQPNEFQSILNQLSGGALWYHGANCDLETFVIRKIEPHTRKVQLYQLTINCAWRLHQQRLLLLSSKDWLYDDDDNITFEPNVAEFWNNHTPSSLIIRTVVVQPRSGDIRISINQDYQFDILINATAGEHWLLQRDGLEICSYRS